MNLDILLIILLILLVFIIVIRYEKIKIIKEGGLDQNNDMNISLVDVKIIQPLGAIF